MDGTTIWISGYNQPGYMPENDPDANTDFEMLRRGLIETIEQFADDESVDMTLDTPENVAMAHHRAAKFGAIQLAIKEATEGEVSVIANGWCFWITRR